MLRFMEWMIFGIYLFTALLTCYDLCRDRHESKILYKQLMDEFSDTKSEWVDIDSKDENREKVGKK